MKYTVAKEGSAYVTRANFGSIVVSNADFAVMMNTLRDLLVLGDEVYVAGNIYPTLTSLVSNNGITMFGAGMGVTILKAAPGMNTGIMEFQARAAGQTFRMSEITLDGDRGVGQLTLGDGMRTLDMNAYLYHVEIKNTWGSGVVFIGRYLAGADHVEAVNCVFRNIGDPVAHVGAGIRLGGDQFHIKDAYIAYNLVENGYEHGIKAYLGVDHVVIDSNNITNTYASGIWNENPGEITNNTITNIAGTGIVVGSTEGDIIPSPVIVAYNRMVKMGLVHPWSGGVYINPGAKKTVVKYNYISDCPEHGMQILADGVLVEGNEIWRAAQYGVLVGAPPSYPVSGVRVINNKIYSSGIAPIKDDGVGTVMLGNLYDTLWKAGLSKITTSANIASPLIAQGFELAVNEVFYTEQGGIITFGAKAVAGYSISAFRINGVDYAPDTNGLYSLTVGIQDYTVQAVYALLPPQTFKLNLNTTTGGTTNPSPGILEYPLGATAVVTALPSTGYKLQQWELDGAIYTENPISVIMNQDHVLLAVFAALPPPIPSHILVVTTTPIVGVPIVLNGQNYITPTPPITLPEGSYSVSCPSNVIIGSDTYNFSQWEDGSTNPQRMFPLTADATIMASYVLVQPPPAKGSIEVHAFLESTEIVVSGVVVETGQTFQTPTTIIVDPGTYVVRVTKDTQVKEQWAVVTQDQTIRLDFQFQPPAPISPLSKVLPVLAPILIGGVSLSIPRRG